MTNPRRIAFVGVMVIALAVGWPGIPPAQAAPPVQEGGAISYGETVTGEITDREFEQLWTFGASAGDVISISVTAEGFSSYLFLMDSEGEIVAELASRHNFGVDLFYVTQLDDADVYTIIITRVGGRTGNGSGSYNLTLNRLPLIPWESPATLTLDAEGQEWAYLVFEAEAPQTITLDYKIVFGALRPNLRLASFEYDEARGEVTSSELFDFSGVNVTAASFVVELPAAGLYIASVQRPSWEDQPGVFDFTITPAE